MTDNEIKKALEYHSNTDIATCKDCPMKNISKSPIELTTSNIMTEIRKSQDNQIYQTVLKAGVNVDKDELIKALQYDRQQYEKGYADAVEKVATILAEMLDTPCNFSPTDEWLPYVCDYKYSCDCEYKECWKQLFKHWDERKCGDAE